jgi:hypothetical protein
MDYPDLNQERSNINPFTILLVIYIVSLIFSMIPVLTEIRYIKYIVAFFSPFFLLPRKEYYRYLDKYYMQNIIMYLVIIMISFINILLKEDVYQRFFEESVFILTPAIFTFFLFRYFYHDKKDFYVKFLFWGISISYLILLVISNLQGLSFVFNPYDFLINKSRSLVNTSHSFYFVFFIIYFFFKKNRRYLLISLFFFVLSAKRVSLIGLVMVILIYFFYKKKEFSSINLKIIIPVAIVLNLIVVYLIYNFTLGEYDYLFGEITGRFSDDVVSGRKGIYNIFFEKFDLTKLSILGEGIGKVMDVISRYAGFKFNFHSDILKNYTEMGPIIFVTWIYFLYKLNSKNLISFLYIIYINVLFISDNAFVYFDVLFLFYFFIGISLIEQEENEIEQEGNEIEQEENGIGLEETANYG